LASDHIPEDSLFVNQYIESVNLHDEIPPQGLSVGDYRSPGTASSILTRFAPHFLPGIVELIVVFHEPSHHREVQYGHVPAAAAAQQHVFALRQHVTDALRRPIA
jgi:hypothetical protein